MSSEKARTCSGHGFSGLSSSTISTSGLFDQRIALRPFPHMYRLASLCECRRASGPALCRLPSDAACSCCMNKKMPQCLNSITILALHLAQGQGRERPFISVYILVKGVDVRPVFNESESPARRTGFAFSFHHSFFATAFYSRKMMNTVPGPVLVVPALRFEPFCAALGLAGGVQSCCSCGNRHTEFVILKVGVPPRRVRKRPQNEDARFVHLVRAFVN